VYKLSIRTNYYLNPVGASGALVSYSEGCKTCSGRSHLINKSNDNMRWRKEGYTANLERHINTNTKKRN